MSTSRRSEKLPRAADELRRGLTFSPCPFAAPPPSPLPSWDFQIFIFTTSPHRRRRRKRVGIVVAIMLGADDGEDGSRNGHHPFSDELSGQPEGEGQSPKTGEELGMGSAIGIRIYLAQVNVGGVVVGDGACGRSKLRTVEEVAQRYMHQYSDCIKEIGFK